MHKSTQFNGGQMMEQQANPISYAMSVIGLAFGAMTLQEWLAIFSMICMVWTTISATRVNRAKRNWYEKQNQTDKKPQPNNEPEE